MLTIKNLKISYGNHIIIENSDLDFPTGLTCLIGSSGSGKSSILNALMHQIKFEADQYDINDEHLLNKSTEMIRANFAYLVQGSNFISDMSCYDNIRLYAQMGNKDISDEKIQEYLHLVGLNHVTNKSYPDQLSGGEKQRMAIAQAIAKNTPVILCDEITASLDGETKQEIFRLLKDLADQYQKIIIMTSHDEDIYEQCDKIYYIESKKVFLQKDSSGKSEQSFTLKKSLEKLNYKKLNIYISSKIERQKLLSILYSLICGLIVSLCAFLVFFTWDYLSEQSKILERLSQKEINIINQSRPAMEGASYIYYYDNQCFDDNVINQIYQTKHLQNIYPYYWMTLNPNTRTLEPADIKMTLMYEDKEDISISKLMTPFEFSLIPYYPEQEFEKKMEIINPENKEFGVYINDIFLLMTGLTKEDLTGAVLKTTVYPPSAYIETNFGYRSENDETYTSLTGHMPVGDGIEVELPILGYVDFWYGNDDWGNSFIYCPFDYMEKLREDATKNYVLKNDEHVWMPNAFKAFVDDLDNIEQVNIDIRSINDQIATGSNYTERANFFKQRTYVKNTAIIALSIVLIAGSILSYAYGVYYHQKNANDIAYFKRNGLSLFEFRKLLILDCGYQILMNILFALPMTIVITYFGQIKLNMWRFGLISWQSVWIALGVILFAAIQTLISRIYYYQKVKK